MPYTTADALRDTLISPNVSDSNFEPANVVDALAGIAQAINNLASAVREHTDRTATTPSQPTLHPDGGISFSCCPKYGGTNFKAKGSFDKCMDCGERVGLGWAPVNEITATLKIRDIGHS